MNTPELKLSELKAKSPTELLAFAEELEVENAKLKRLLAEQMLIVEGLREINKKKW